MSTKTEHPTFHQWLTKRSTRNDALGDLARTAVIDPAWPKDATDAQLRDYLRSRAGAASPILTVFERALGQWRKERGAKS